MRDIPSLSKIQVSILEALAGDNIKVVHAEADFAGEILKLLSLKLVGNLKRLKDGTVSATLTNRGQWFFERVPWDSRIN